MIPLTGFGTIFILIATAMIIILPKRWVSIPFLIGACYMVLSQGVKLGPFHFYSIRLIITAGILRIILKSERPVDGLNTMDRFMLFWSVWALISSFFHVDPFSALTFSLGLIFNSCGIYFLLRTFIQTLEDAIRLCQITIIILAMVAAGMLYEKLTSHNIFSLLGGVPDIPNIREGKIRAQGPFAHAILAGTVGSVCLPIAVGLWCQYRKSALIGIIICTSIIISSASSGPLMSGLFAIGALMAWPYRHQMRTFRWLVIICYIVLDLTMKVPPYYLLGRIDLSGGSTGWHRAELINSGLHHLDEWWLGGTDYTRHWMPTGVSWNPDHTDITNHYLQLGVIGGLPLMLLFITILAKGFSYVGQIWRQPINNVVEHQFFVWALGASLFAHATTMISVSYFDQSFLFLYLLLAIISSIAVNTIGKETPEAIIEKRQSKNLPTTFI